MAQVRIILREDVHGLGLAGTVVSVRPGYARLSMRVTADMINSHGLCHGGMIFTLADEAFAYACNSHGHGALAASAAIDFLAPAHLGDVLEAEGIEQARAGRAGVYDIRVSRRDGGLVALFRGRSAAIRGKSAE